MCWAYDPGGMVLIAFAHLFLAHGPTSEVNVVRGADDGVNAGYKASCCMR